MNYKKLAAIDIGSNAMRLLISLVIEEGKEVDFKKTALIRLPIRLGQEAFTDKKISEQTIERFMDGMQAFKYLMRVHEVVGYRACATSAMREAENGNSVVEMIREKAGIDVEIIDGDLEAQIIFNAHFKDKMDPESNYIYVDVGGGSTELTILSKGEIKNKHSFKVGTIRSLNGTVDDAEWRKLKSWVKESTGSLDHLEMIGSGGNINKIYKLLNKEYPRPLLYHELKIMKQALSRMSFEERMKNYRLNPDRADVILPASEIYFNVMKWSDCSIMHVPKIGLSDGIIQGLYNDKKAKG